jgi:RNA-directed DNA polymerase
VNYHRFADDIVITVSGHHTKRGWAARALLRLQEHLQPLGVEVNQEKTTVVDTTQAETFTFLGFEVRRVRKRTGDGHFILLTPRKKARLALKARVRELLRQGGATPLKELIAQLNTVLMGWVQYFRVGNASRVFSEIRDYVEMKVRILLTRRKRRHKRGGGWQRWSNEYLYAVLGLFWDWKLRPLPSAGAYQ